VPAEFKVRTDDYVDLGVDEMLPAVTGGGGEESFCRPRFCDVFCEDGAFSVDQSGRVLEAALALGLAAKIHVDEFKPLGGTTLAVRLGATSADHLVCTPPDELEALARSETIAVALPGTLSAWATTNTRLAPHSSGRRACPATDCNPHLLRESTFIVALACRTMRLTADEISAATINAMHGLGHEVGSLEPANRQTSC
jgi:imidazolonepropionase